MKDNKALFYYSSEILLTLRRYTPFYNFNPAVGNKKEFLLLYESLLYESSKANKLEVLKSKIKLSLFLNNLIVHVEYEELLVLTS